MIIDTIPAPAVGTVAPHPVPLGLRLPRGLREEAGALPADVFRARYSPTNGPLRLRNWQCLTDGRPTGPQALGYQATLAVGDRIGTSTAAACGPVAALTMMLHDRGIAIELLSFHQIDVDDGIATFVRGSDGVGDAWAMGRSDDPTESALRAIVNCANRLYDGS